MKGGRKGSGGRGGGARQPLSRARPGAARKDRGRGAAGSGPAARSGRSKAEVTAARGKSRGLAPTPAGPKLAAKAKGETGPEEEGRRERGRGKGTAERARKTARAGGPPQKTRSHRSPSPAPPKSRTSHPYSPATPDRHPERVPADPDTVRTRLHATFPDAHCALDHQNAYQLLVATILSAQCTDARVNMVTPALFERFPDPASLADADRGELESLIKSTGFFRNKTKSLTGMAQAVVQQHSGEIPSQMDELTALPGVGRKTANVILGNAFGKNEGVVVDTHVARISYRLGLTKSTDPVKIEQDLMRQFPRDEWTLLSHLFIDHGRQICQARSPRCENCPLADICPSSLT